MTSLSGLEKLASVGYSFRINNNINLKSLDGLESLREAGFLYLSYSNVISDIKDLSNLTTLHGIQIEHCSNLVSVSGFNKVDSMEGNIALNDNSNLEIISGFQNLQKLGGMNIYNNNNFRSMAGFENLKEVLDISVHQNKNLEVIDGLKNLKSIRYLTLNNNKNLSDYCILKSYIDVISNLTIEFNLYNPSRQDIIEGNCSK